MPLVLNRIFIYIVSRFRYSCKRPACSGYLAAVFFLMSSCSKDPAILIELDLSRKSQWRYFFGADIVGTMSSPDTSLSFNSNLRTFLATNSSSRGDTIHFRASQSRIVSSTFDEQETFDLVQAIEHQRFRFCPSIGALSESDSGSLQKYFGAWDFYRSFVKVIPALPAHAVRPGSSWERNFSFPVKTTFATASGHLYQMFTFDSISERSGGNRIAHISWEFSYSVSLESKRDSGSIIDEIPRDGKGRGSAAIDITEKKLDGAHANFELFSDEQSRVKTSLNESVHLELVN